MKTLRRINKDLLCISVTLERIAKTLERIDKDLQPVVGNHVDAFRPLGPKDA